MIFIERQKMDIIKWDNLVMNSPEKSIYSLSWYMDSISDSKWGIITDENYSKGIALAYKSRSGYKNIYQPFYSMFSDAINCKNNIDDVLNEIKNKFDFIHITSNQRSNLFTNKSRIRQELDTKNFNGLKSYNENAQRMVKKAEKNCLLFKKHYNALEVVNFFKENKGNALKEFKQKDYQRLQKLIELCITHKYGFCGHIVEGKKVLASGFFIEFDNRLIYLKGGVNEDGKNLGAMYYLIHNTILIAKEHHYIYDFGGSNDKKVAEFYRKFGGNNISYNEIIIDNETKIQKLLKKVF